MYIPPKSAGVVVAGSSQSLKIHFTEAEKSKKKRLVQLYGYWPKFIDF